MIIPVPPAPWYLRPLLWIAKRFAGQEPLPGRLLAAFPKGALGAGVFELCAAGAPGDLDGRSLAVARIVASTVAGCPFCVDMNAATFQRAGLSLDELQALLRGEEAVFAALGAREGAAARYARALSLTPVILEDALVAELTATFTPKELVVLASTIAQVNFWSRFNQGLGVPAAGFFDAQRCALPAQVRENKKPTIAP